MKFLFFSDLDNTLIYSSRHILPKEKRVVEYKEGRELSSMTEKTFKFLEQLQAHQEVMLVPLTTRTVEQYQRIEVFQKELLCKFALVCNGAILLEENQINRSWEKESLDMAGNQLEELERAYDKMASFIDQSHLKMVRSLLAYGISENPEECCATLETSIDSTKIDIFYNSRKVYCIPKAFSKGMAVIRFRERYPTEIAVGAGDSSLDVSMLSACEYSFGSEKIARRISRCNLLPLYGEFALNDILHLEAVDNKKNTD